MSVAADWREDLLEQGRANATRVVAVCCRISVDKSGRTEGVKAQARWGTEYAAEAWPGMPVEIYADGNNSAMKDDGDRPDHERFKRDLAEGRIAHVWSVEQSRLERDEIRWFMLAAELEAAGVGKVHTRRDGIVDVRGEVAGIKAVLNAGEIRKMKKRLHDTLADKAALGEAPGSKPFGYVHGRLPDGAKTYVIVPEQAEAIRKAAQLILAGWSRESVARELRKAGLVGTYRMKVKDPATGEPMLDEQGQPITRPSRITAGTVTSMVTNPSVAGHRVYQDRIVGRGNWEPILDEDTWQAVRAKLKAPHVVRRTDGGTYPIGEAHFRKGSGRKYLMSGELTRCGVCEAPLVGTPLKRRNKAGVRVTPYLLCHPRKKPDGTTLGAGCVGIMMVETEAYVVREMFAKLDKPAFLKMIGADSHVADRKRIMASLEGLDRKRDALVEMWALPAGAPGALTMAEWQTARTELAVHEQELRRELAEVPPPLLKVDLARAREAWPEMTLDEQREFIRKVIRKVTINRAIPGTKGFDKGRVVIEWQKRKR